MTARVRRRRPQLLCKVGASTASRVRRQTSDPPGPYGTNVGTRAPNRSTPSGNRARGNLSWHVTDDILLYTRGLRLSGGPVQSLHLVPQPATPRAQIIYCVPAFTVPDNVTNNEIGWKTDGSIIACNSTAPSIRKSGATLRPASSTRRAASATWRSRRTGELPRQGGRASVIARVTHGRRSSVGFLTAVKQTNSPI